VSKDKNRFSLFKNVVVGSMSKGKENVAKERQRK
jgi:hypothetical protein